MHEVMQSSCRFPIIKEFEIGNRLRVVCACGSDGASERGSRERGSEGARGARARGSEGARERGSERARERERERASQREHAVCLSLGEYP